MPGWVENAAPRRRGYPGRDRQHGLRSAVGPVAHVRGGAGCAELVVGVLYRQLTIEVRLMPLKIMSLTDAAAERVREIMEDSDTPVIGVRVGIKNAGCAGQAYTLDYVRRAPVPGDDHVDDKGVDVYIEPKATLFLLGTVMDFEEDMLKSGFTFKNPQPDRRMRLRRERDAEARRTSRRSPTRAARLGTCRAEVRRPPARDQCWRQEQALDGGAEGVPRRARLRRTSRPTSPAATLCWTPRRAPTRDRGGDREDACRRSSSSIAS